MVVRKESSCLYGRIKTDFCGSMDLDGTLSSLLICQINTHGDWVMNQAEN